MKEINQIILCDLLNKINCNKTRDLLKPIAKSQMITMYLNGTVYAPGKLIGISHSSF